MNINKQLAKDLEFEKTKSLYDFQRMLTNKQNRLQPAAAAIAVAKTIRGICSLTCVTYVIQDTELRFCYFFQLNTFFPFLKAS